MDLNSLGLPPNEVEAIAKNLAKMGIKTKQSADIESSNLDVGGLYQSMEDMEKLKRRVTESEIMIHALWSFIKHYGNISSEELNATIEGLLQVRYSKKQKNEVICPDCGKVMQKVNKDLFTFKCYYCGAEQIQNPFDCFDITPEPEEQEDVKEKTPETDEDILNKTFEPYDVTKDLHFEDDEDEFGNNN